MATIIIQGTQEENMKATIVLKEKFATFVKKATFKSDVGETVIVEVDSQDFEKKEFTDAETLKALAYCSNAERDCARCPYRKVKDCSKRVFTDGAVVVSRMHNK